MSKHVAGFFGSYDYKYLCMPRWNPWARKNAIPPPFFSYDEKISPFLALLMGLQHALAMVGGIITPPLIVAGQFTANLGVKQTQYLISASLIVSGLCSFLQVYQPRIPFTKILIGSGVLSVMGTSFTFLPIAQAAIPAMIATDGDTGEEAYGRFLGTCLCVCWIPILTSLIPPKALRRIFPPVVTGVTVFLIGAALVGTGIRTWGGGVYCGENLIGFDGQPTLCTNNGEVQLVFGSAPYIGLGFVVFAGLWFLELFGSPFMRNTNVIIALMFGFFISSVITYDGKDFVTNDKIKAADWVTFLWVYTYPIGIYGPAVLPLILGYLIVTVETVGDITATEEASNLEVVGPEHSARVSNALRGDFIAGAFAALGTTMPNTTFAQNNGVISLTRCSARRAGMGCAFWLVFFGVIAKFAAFFTSIPDCVLGGMTTFLFANVSCSGIKILSNTNRRDRFILACALTIGLGVAIAPEWAENNLWPEKADMSDALLGLRQGVLLILETPFCIGCFISLFLNLLLPHDIDEGHELHDREEEIVAVLKGETLEREKEMDLTYLGESKEGTAPAAVA